MVAFGCTRAPYYDPDPRCTKRHGYHHGLDLAMPCGTTLYAAYRTRVVDPSSSGSLGSAYGPWAFRLRSARFHKDFVIGHVRRVFVEPGDLVARGQRIARASDAGAPDGCHLHIEVRPVGGGYQSAVRPYRFLGLARPRR
jgi:murein DD-endopeptidase MepM/ murein hydrolase activator NlpD